MRQPRTIGFRLTLWGAGITLLVSLLVCSILCFGVRYSLYQQVDNFLEEEIHEFVGVVREHPSEPRVAEDAIREHLASRTREDLLFRVLDQNGLTVINSDPSDPLKGAFQPAAGSKIEGAVHETIRSVSGKPLRVCSIPVPAANGKGVMIAQAGYLLDRANASFYLVLKATGLALLFSVILAVLAGKTLSTRSLDPLLQMTRIAEQISTSRLTDRLPRSNNGDELDRLAAVLNDLLDRVEKYVLNMQQFTADASHELRSPLAALRGSTEVALSRHRTSEELKKVLEDNAEHYDRLIRITEDLLLLARMDAGEAILRRDPLVLNEAVEDVVDLFAPVAHERGLTLEMKAEPGLNVIGDAGRLRQLMANLVDNAIKYTPAPGSIIVSVQRFNGSARLNIVDTGIGIAPGELSKVFDRFYRCDRSRSKIQTSGVGLGLAICRSIVIGHGGTIAATSQEGNGTTMVIDLPLAGPSGTSSS